MSSALLAAESAFKHRSRSEADVPVANPLRHRAGSGGSRPKPGVERRKIASERIPAQFHDQGQVRVEPSNRVAQNEGNPSFSWPLLRARMAHSDLEGRRTDGSFPRQRGQVSWMVVAVNRPAPALALKESPRHHRKPEGRTNTVVLAVAQGLFTAAASIDLTLTGLTGYQLAPDKSLATLPFALITVAGAVTTLFASLLMERIGRRWGFVMGASTCAAGGLLSVDAVYRGSFWSFCLGTASVGVFQAFAQYCDLM